MRSSVSESRRSLLFVVNPNAGKKISERIIQAITTSFPAHISYRIVIWKDKNDFSEIESLLGSGEFTDAVAVGGDGTVNRVAQAVVNTDITLGIIPIGSGNGLARSLGLSMKIEEVLKQIIKGEVGIIDTGSVNDQLFVCTSGIGFDAHIGKLFADSVERGLSSYIKITLKELFSYRARYYSIEIHGAEFKRKAFLITVANAGQYGNDFYIAPQASMTDGLFHVAILRPFNPINVFGILYKILRKKAHRSSRIETYVTDQVKISRRETGSIHFDGEPAMDGRELVYKNSKASLKVTVGETFNRNMS